MPTPGDPALGGGAPQAFGVEGQWELHRTGAHRDATPEKCTQDFVHTGSQGRAETPQELGSDLPVVLGGSPGKTGCGCGSLGGKGSGGKGLGMLITVNASSGGHLGKSGPAHHSSELPQHGKGVSQSNPGSTGVP